MQVKHTVLIALSTLNNKDTWFSRIFNRKDDAINRLISRVQVEWICKRCKAEGMISCQCLKALQPAHLGEKSDMTQLLIPNEKLYSEEVLGLIMEGNDGKLFNSVWIDDILSKPRITNKQIKQLQGIKLCTFIDPKGKSGDGKTKMTSSYVSVITVGLTRADDVIIFAMDEMVSSDLVKQKPFFENYFTNLKCDPVTANLEHIIFIENNHISIGDRIYASIAAQILPQTVFYAMTEEKTGARTGQNKYEAAHLSILDLLNKKVWLIEELKCSALSTMESKLTEFSEQMKRIELKDEKITGKIDGFHDDMAIAFIMSCYWARRYNEEVLQRDAAMARDERWKEENDNTILYKNLFNNMTN